MSNLLVPATAADGLTTVVPSFTQIPIDPRAAAESAMIIF